jgi:hypothetical protein
LVSEFGASTVAPTPGCMRNCTASRRTDFEDTAGNTPSGVDILARLAVRRPGEVQVLLAVAVVVVAAAAAAVVVVAAAAERTVTPSDSANRGRIG